MFFHRVRKFPHQQVPNLDLVNSVCHPFQTHVPASISAMPSSWMSWYKNKKPAEEHSHFLVDPVYSVHGYPSLRHEPTMLLLDFRTRKIILPQEGVRIITSSYNEKHINIYNTSPISEKWNLNLMFKPIIAGIFINLFPPPMRYCLLIFTSSTLR